MVNKILRIFSLFAVTSFSIPFLHAQSSVTIDFAYSSEKALWIEEVTDLFNKGTYKIANGKRIQVTLHAEGSGEMMRKLLAGKLKAHLVSPASDDAIVLADAESKEKTGQVLIGPTTDIVRSPVVIAMWEPMAKAMGWGKKPIGWAEIISMADQPEGWGAFDYPRWGKFKLGHTHPLFSNSGLMALLAEVYACRRKEDKLTLNDLQSTDVRDCVEAIEKTVIHYGDSTGFFGRKMFTEGPEYLSASVLYENMVIESYSSTYKDNLQFPIVAIYPKEGTFWSNHPTGAVQRDWVTDEHREAIQVYLDFLLARPQQELAMKHGFRPVDTTIPLVAPLDTAHGIDPQEPKVLLPIPSVEVIQAVLKDLWVERKKHANVVLTIDTSGSMRQAQKIVNARQGVLKALSLMEDADYLSLLTFNDQLDWSNPAIKGIQLEKGRKAIENQIKTLFAGGDTALYNAIAEAYHYLQTNPKPDLIAAVIVLSDGREASDSVETIAVSADGQKTQAEKVTLEKLLEQVKFNSESKAIRIYTIAYGADADKTILQKIATISEGEFIEGTPENIEALFYKLFTTF